ncbi:MAG: sensor histidine kinase [archaeon]
MSKEEIAEFAGAINQSAKKINGLTNNLLKWSMLQSGRLNSALENLNLRGEAESIKELFMSSTHSKLITISNEVGSNNEACADREMVTTLLRNLISNAIKFTGTGGHITISSKNTGDFLEVSVADSGIGMKEEEMDKIFRIDSAYSSKGTNGETGSGLGLVLCKELVEKNGGKISVSSTPGKGTIFSFTLPSCCTETAEN